MLNRTQSKFIITTLMAFMLSVVSTLSMAKTVQHELGTVTFEQTPKRVVVLDWALAESVLALGVQPIAAADVKGYQDWVGSPALPSDTIDVGSRREPNLELIASLKPDLILMSGHLAPAYEKLNAIAPTIAMSIYNDKQQPYENAKSLVTMLGEVFNKQEQAKSVIAQTEKKLADNGAKVAQLNNGKPFLMVRFIGDKHVRVHSTGSLMNDTISLCRLKIAGMVQLTVGGFLLRVLNSLPSIKTVTCLFLVRLPSKSKRNLTRLHCGEPWHFHENIA